MSVIPLVSSDTGRYLSKNIQCFHYDYSYLCYLIDPFKLIEFEKYGKMWIPLVEKFGGNHHGYYMPHEGASNIAIALFLFPSLTAYEVYREKMTKDPECKKAFVYADETCCIKS